MKNEKIKNLMAKKKSFCFALKNFSKDFFENFYTQKKQY